MSHADDDRIVAPWAAAAAGCWSEVRDYWRAEAAMESAALGRLRALCRRRGWDYQRTIEVLR